ncbi:zinc chelation protein SecC [Aestuariicella hydrocarbonica]|uniref:Zinc chelation protein SecC n=1 Tax=Pseudomaricurvus hydrocarbonicus TaxID=1470433 RepID=A0A9E5MQL8_9GAMM|nr:SEC-C domain-containing protein [Aestuariicella hydrocarbonica]NHO68512.1 zinc chelation protein SecC [Aestuariicella hydrocarbonica]
MKIELTRIEHINTVEIRNYREKLLEWKQKAQEIYDEQRANDIWLASESLEVNVLFIKAFDNLKNGNFREAWGFLEGCEIKCVFIEKNSDKRHLTESRVLYIQESVKKFQSLYPYCVFVSPGFKVGYYTCSICGQKVRPRSRCGHKKGSLYNGELCLHEGHELDLMEVSIVSRPVQKYSVMHDDSTLDFSVLEHLMSFLEHAFEEWEYEKKTMSFPREKFESVLESDKCPCRSGLIFKECCSGKEEVSMPHIDFIFSKDIPPEKQEIKFPYGSPKDG